jgi:predicted aspartyl protease
MIEGIVNQYREPTVELTVRGPAGHEERLEFVIDTGFDGAVMLHSSVAAALHLPHVGLEHVMLADGSVIAQLWFRRVGSTYVHRLGHRTAVRSTGEA